MKIENNNLNPVAPQQKPEGVQPAAKGTHAVSSVSKDRAELSDQARLLSKARLAAHETSDVRPEKVQEIKQRITDGTYTIPYRELAGRLMPIVSGQKE
jgi:flagellar biosynthesis anti-sigma factor FlgM